MNPSFLDSTMTALGMRLPAPRTPSAYYLRHDPERVKTEEDLTKMAISRHRSVAKFRAREAQRQRALFL